AAASGDEQVTISAGILSTLADATLAADFSIAAVSRWISAFARFSGIGIIRATSCLAFPPAEATGG
ncbi:MAG: hypothetical protein MI861_12020, partial [Pirellulales bacterium]|nr:hypothetical protein [Pirellulales bacterium]